jgi:hypothetical protein
VEENFHGSFITGCYNESEEGERDHREEDCAKGTKEENFGEKLCERKSKGD